MTRKQWDTWKRQITEELGKYAESRISATNEQKDSFIEGVYQALREMTSTLVLQNEFEQ